MINNKFIERNGKFDKDKNSERSKKILPEEAIHFRMLPINGFGRNIGKCFITGFLEFMWSRGCKLELIEIDF